MERVLFICALVSLAATLVATRNWIRKAPHIGLVGPDMNKPGKPKVPEMGGICVVFGFVLGSLAYIGYQTFYHGKLSYIPVLAALCTVLMACIIGIMDDLLGWKVGLRQWQKPIFTLFAAMPMMVINAGHSTMELPLLGRLDWGVLFPLAIVPIGIIGASNAYNMIAGYNGLEAGMGVIILSALGYVSLTIDNPISAALSLIMVGALLSFLYYNWYPARVFPGDTMTYSVGALVACVAILGNMEKIAVMLFIPYAVDFIIQAKGGFMREAFARVNEDGSLEKPYKGIYHVTHLVIAMLRRVKGKVYERDIVLFMLGVETVVVGLSLYIFLYVYNI
jgi:UDP-N-acetylglucosamine--dolichyl-phosphate N-acetylglucosaminephosphotransferase